jgi:hypothetical protein
MKRMVRFTLQIAGRALIDRLLLLVGLFNPAPFFTRRQGGRKSVVFQAYAVHVAQFYQPIIMGLLQKRELYDVTFQILYHPHFPLSAAHDLKRFAHKVLGVPRKSIKFFWQTFWDEFDLVVCSDIFARFPRRAARTCLIPHGPGLTDRVFTRSIFRKSLQDFDMVLVSGQYDDQLAKNFCRCRDMKTRVVQGGFPFLDGLDAPSLTRELYFKRLGLDPGKGTVMIAPSWRGLTLAPGKGAAYMDDVISSLKGLAYNIVLKPHACSLNRIMADKVDWRNKLARLSQEGAVRVDMDQDDRPAIKFSDVLITDISSRAFVFMLLGKPAIHYFPGKVALDSLDAQRLELLRRGCLMASRPGDIPDLLRALGTSEYRNPQAAEVASLCFSNFGRSTAFVLRVFDAWLGEKKPITKC